MLTLSLHQDRSLQSASLHSSSKIYGIYTSQITRYTQVYSISQFTARLKVTRLANFHSNTSFRVYTGQSVRKANVKPQIQVYSTVNLLPQDTEFAVCTRRLGSSGKPVPYVIQRREFTLSDVVVAARRRVFRD